jgi:hypothetical protein
LSYDDTDGTSKGIVSSLTNIVNAFSTTKQATSTNPSLEDRGTTSNNLSEMPLTVASASLASALPPRSPQELLERIQSDYQEHNYLWTGNLDLACFQETCRFTDPTLSFEGTDKFTENTQNLVPLVDAFVENSESRLLSIELVEDDDGEGGSYIQTRWNMIGSLTASPWFFWKPKIDVIGRTKFWFQQDEGSESGQRSYRVYFYDEEWEIPAYQALLQLITPAGTFPNSRSDVSQEI